MKKSKNIDPHGRNLHALRLYQINKTLQEITMREVIDWIDRELARLDFVIRYRKKGLLKRVVCCLIAKYLTRTDPTPEALKKALGDFD